MTLATNLSGITRNTGDSVSKHQGQSVWHFSILKAEGAKQTSGGH